MARSILPSLVITWLCLPALGQAAEHTAAPASGGASGGMIEGVHAASSSGAPAAAMLEVVASPEDSAQACEACEGRRWRLCKNGCPKVAKLCGWLCYRPARCEKSCRLHKERCQGCNWPQLHTYLLYKCRWACDAPACDQHARVIDWHLTPESPCPPPFHGCCDRKDGKCGKGCR